MASVYGTDNPETLDAADGVTNGADTIFGFLGNDLIFGLGGNDELKGGGGADRLDGGSGIDTANYSDSTVGVTVNLLSGTGIGGTAEGDTLISIENVTGSGKADFLTGNDGSNVLTGLEDNDILKGAGGADTLHGDSGNDTLKGGGGADILNGGSGVDTASYVGSSAAVYVSLSADTAESGDAEGDELNSIENLTGSEHDDTLSGNDAANILRGLDGDDRFYGRGGNDSIWGGDGDDTLVGESGDNTLRGENGNDALWDFDGGFDTLIGGAGNDEYHIADSSHTIVEGTSEGASDRVVAYGNFTLQAGAHIEVVQVYSGPPLYSTSIIGNNFVQTMIGNDAANIINGGGGADHMIGAFGDDIFVVASAGDSTIEAANGGTDTVRSYINWTLANNVERLELQSSGNINGTGNTLANTLVGNSGNNVLSGGNGNDYISAGAGNDTLNGGAGNDTLIGAAGRDTLNGGAGNDVFDFDLVSHSPAGPATRDSIVGGFSHGSDRINLATIDANTLAGGNQAFSFIGSAAFTGVAGQLRYTNYSGTVIIDADVNGDSAADMQILVAGTTWMTGTDFVV